MEIIYILLGMLLFGGFLLLYMYRQAFEDRVLKQEIRLKDFPASFGTVRIFFISDIHKRIISDSIINEVKGKPDLVIIGGDLAEKGVSLERISANLEKLKTVGPVFFVWGNNDYEFNSHELDSLLYHSGVKVLDNTAVKFESEAGDILYLLGIDDFGLGKSRLDLAVRDAEEEGFRILVSHNPAIANSLKSEDEISLLLSGHTHGGQIRIFGFGPYELGGIKKKNGTTVLTSNGYGTTGVPFRLGAKAETHLITLAPELNPAD
ncbi:metallophosphoesterase family protein [Mesobacillus sp. AQ2]|uniref:metallophosphoesterase n=1 Tax=Mesobacillus sp. AQ2 TaxID=3043332 RepID=UPI0024C12EE6|nr:metallophosphoesterase [Mesobacillus sp. AQ2]WHX39140.1 metallophosphoesterase family protein [Mesobacillus sp. AQ2]